MSKDAFIIAIVGLAIVNGLFSPVLPVVLPLALIFYPSFLPPVASFLFFFSSLLISTVTIMLAGVPAALYERATHRRSTSELSLWIWLAGVAVLSMPAVINGIGFLR